VGIDVMAYAIKIMLTASNNLLASSYRLHAVGDEGWGR